MHHPRVVRGQQERHALVAQVVHRLQHPVGRGRVELGGRLVRDHDRRPADHRAGEREPLLLAAGQLHRQVVGPPGQPEHAQQPVDLGVLRLDPAQLGREPDLLGRPQVLDQVVDRVLEHVTDRGAAQRPPLAYRQAGDLLAADPDRAGGGPVDAGQDPQQRRLAGPGRPDDRAHPPGRELLVDALERLDPLVLDRVRLVHVLDGGRRLGRGRDRAGPVRVAPVGAPALGAERVGPVRVMSQGGAPPRRRPGRPTAGRRARPARRRPRPRPPSRRGPAPGR